MCWFCLALAYNNMICTRNKGSYMSVHVLLNLLNELRERDKMRGLPSKIKCEAYRVFYLFFASSLINSIIQEHEC